MLWTLQKTGVLYGKASGSPWQSWEGKLSAGFQDKVLMGELTSGRELVFRTSGTEVESEPQEVCLNCWIRKRAPKYVLEKESNFP